MFSKYVQWRLQRYVKKYFKRHHPQLIVVVGSVGKTTTKTAIATALAGHYRIQLEPGNHNSPISVPLAIMGVKYPPMELLRKVSTWRKVFKAMKQRVKAPQGVDVIIQELATDHPGDLAVYGKYLKADIAVVTSISPEHMENFPGGLADVAKEELSVSNFANSVIINSDDVDPNFLTYLGTSNVTGYGIDRGECNLTVNGGSPLAGYNVSITAPQLHGQTVNGTLHLMGNHMLKAACAGMAVGLRLGMTGHDILRNLETMRPVAGRMNPLPGRNGSILIDDSYNSSPVAAIAALDTLYQIDAPQRIAILGTMKELGEYGPQAHVQVGEHCDPMLLDWVITVGDLAGQYLAPAARKAGCQVRSFPDPIAAGTFAVQVLKEDAVVLIKGSQTGVYTEEATKVLLRNTNDKDKLVRQDDYWLKRKQDWYSTLHKQTDEELANE